MHMFKRIVQTCGYVVIQENIPANPPARKTNQCLSCGGGGADVTLESNELSNINNGSVALGFGFSQ